MPASVLGLRGPSPDNTASAPLTAPARTVRSGVDRSAVTTLTFAGCTGRFSGWRDRGDLVARGNSLLEQLSSDTTPVAAKIVSFIPLLQHTLLI